MSWEALYYATKKQTGKSSDKLVLLMLANLADEKGFCFPSHAYLSRVTEMGERTVQRSLDRLVASGIIKKEKRFNESGQTSNGYTLVMEGAKMTPTPRQNDTTPSVTVTPYTDTINLKNNHKKVDQYPEDFDFFWKAYPRRPNDNKWNAFLKWKAATNGIITKNDLLEAAKRFKLASANTDPKFIPMCATWLNQRRYLDEQGEVNRNRNTLAG